MSFQHKKFINPTLGFANETFEKLYINGILTQKFQCRWMLESDNWDFSLTDPDYYVYLNCNISFEKKIGLIHFYKRCVLVL